MIKQHRRLQLGRKEVENPDKSAQNLSDQTVIPIVIKVDIIKKNRLKVTNHFIVFLNLEILH